MRVATTGPLATDDEVSAVRRNRRRGRIAPVNAPVSAPPVPPLWHPTRAAQDGLTAALIDVSRINEAKRLRAETAAAMVAALGPQVAWDFAVTLVELGHSYELALLDTSIDHRAEWLALWNHAAEGAKRVVDALRRGFQTPLPVTCWTCGAPMPGTATEHEGCPGPRMVGGAR